MTTSTSSVRILCCLAVLPPQGVPHPAYELFDKVTSSLEYYIGLFSCPWFNSEDSAFSNCHLPLRTSALSTFLGGYELELLLLLPYPQPKAVVVQVRIESYINSALVA